MTSPAPTGLSRSGAISELANIINLLMIPVSLVLVVLVLTNTSGALRIWLSVLVVILGPGSGIVQFFKLPHAALQMSALVGISAAIDILLGEGVLSIHNISGNAAVCLLAGITCIRPLRVRTNGDPR